MKRAWKNLRLSWPALIGDAAERAIDTYGLTSDERTFLRDVFTRKDEYLKRMVLWAARMQKLVPPGCSIDDPSRIMVQRILEERNEQRFRELAGITEQTRSELLLCIIDELNAIRLRRGLDKLPLPR